MIGGVRDMPQPPRRLLNGMSFVGQTFPHPEGDAVLSHSCLGVPICSGVVPPVLVRQCGTIAEEADSDLVGSRVSRHPDKRGRIRVINGSKHQLEDTGQWPSCAGGPFGSALDRLHTRFAVNPVV